MNKLKILIIDNESPIRQSLKKMIMHFMPEDAIIEEATGVFDGLDKIKAFEPEVLFLDIEMEDGTGFDLLKMVDQIKFELVFTTAHNQYAIQAFEFSAINYLLKPLSPSALQKTLAKAQTNIKHKNVEQQLEILLSQINKKNDNDQKIALKDANGTYFVNIREIVYCQADGPYTKFILSNNETIVISKNLKEYETLLESKRFVRCHHSFLINADLILKFEKTDGGTLQMQGGHRIPVSQRKKEKVITFLAH